MALTVVQSGYELHVAADVDTPVLWHLEISHYNEKARWALDYKGVAHERRAVTPGLQEVRARRLRAGRTTPILEVNGHAIGDSTRIIEEIERRWPDPPLYPADPDERSRALELEDYFDEQCGPHIRRVLFGDNMPEPEKFLAMLYGAEHSRFGLLKAISPVFLPAVKQRFRIRPETIEASRRFRDSLKERPAFSWVEDMYARQRGTSAELAY
jgi:glutathione S-transferase